MNNSLAEVHPELVSEWSEKNIPLTPDDITFGSNKKVWWRGACGHEWQTSVKARSNGEKCPICSGARVIAGINDLATLEPLLVKQWSKKNKIKPTEVSIGSHKKVIWRCEKGHEWEAAVKSRTINKTGCPYCSHNKVLAGFNDLATLLPDIAAEWSDRNYPLLPTQVTVFANRKAWWKCKDCRREWNTLISTRSGGSKCPYCSGYIFLKGFNDLQTTHPEIASEWSEKNLSLKPDEVNAKSRKNVWWRCSKCGNEWKSVINARVKGTVCPVCAEREVLAGYNDLATTDSQLLSEWDYEKNKWKPTEVSRNSAKRAWWKCRHGHSWSMKINERTILNKGCRICEQEYLSLFPALAVSYYSNRKGLKAELGSDRLLGVPLETYIASEKLAIESGSADENMRSRGVSVSIILQNLAQLKALFEKQWESIVGNCDEFLYLGGNEQSTHKYVSELLGKETIDTNTFGKSTGRSGNYSTNYQISGRELLTPDEVRMLDNQYAILFIRGERPIMDFKYDIMKHPNVALTTDGKASPYKHGEVTKDIASIAIWDIDPATLPEKEMEETNWELLSDEEMEALFINNQTN